MSYVGNSPNYQNFARQRENGGAASYTLDYTPGSQDAILVFVDGVAQDATADYTVSGNTLTPTTVWPAGTDNVVIVFLGRMADVGVTADGTVSTAKLQDEAVTPSKLSSAVYQAMRGNIAGLTLSNNTADATNDIDIAAGSAVDGSVADVLVLGSALTKRLDAAWAVGSGNGGLDTGSIANGTYHVWLIKNPATGVVDALFSTSATAPTMPSGYTLKRRIGSILRESAAIVAFSQRGDEFLRKQSITDHSGVTQGTTATLRTLSVPTGIAVWVRLSMLAINASAGTSMSVYSPDHTADSGPQLMLREAAGNAGQGGDFIVRTNTSAQVYTDATVASTLLHINTYGWIDRRGRDE